ncbi:copper homeostasis protein CutC [Actinocrinis puniceicyclus]|uniref:Copper homeostasis protein cutC homolog n=1 Tax=Actinocrinis puniceicyclus TaxID=977794 RepID=A0A8J7WJL8_9ACTN|nr:copper homeostasis protein CutC [Actinocrinis puniceicyclus]MBS2962538.1 copper homeostasis protein CutC [Actinocrinis puniceicyclus]
MTKALLEVIALDATDARLAVEGGADRLELVSSMRSSGFNPSLEAFASIRAAVNVPLRVMIRSRDGFLAGGPGAASTLAASARQLREAGADQFVMGWLDPEGAVDMAALETVLGAAGGAPWTFHKAIDQAADREAVYAAIRTLPGLDTVLTSGGPFPAAQGIGTLAQEAAREAARPDGVTLLVGGGLRLEDVPALRTAGLSAFHIGTAARFGGDWNGPVDAELVASWRAALDEPLGEAAA